MRFGPSGYDEPTGLLAKLRQTSSVQEYQEQFKNLANRTEGLNELFMVSCFVAGLRRRCQAGCSNVPTDTVNGSYKSCSLSRRKEHSF